jgi:hypothetical protein
MRNRTAGFLLSVCMLLPGMARADGGGDPLVAGKLSAGPVRSGQAAPAAPALPDEEAIKRAVREVLAEEKESQQAEQQPATVLRSTTEQKLSRAFDDAQVPLCLHSDGLRHQPTSIGPIGVAGLFALPFVAVAAARGVCRM